MSQLSEGLFTGNPQAIARAISIIEDESPAADDLIREIFPRTGRAYLVGMTGPPGVGKSTLVDRMIGEVRRAGQTVGVIAVDPSSPFSGGALLADRVRMQAHAGDAGVFIRSMATRGRLGGLSRGTGDAALVLDAAGKDLVIIETVGVGQGEVDIVRTADVAVVTLVPGLGDEIQALKAGLMEIADIFVVNKIDREGADGTAAAIESSLSLHTFGEAEWRPPIVRTQATTGQGVPELLESVRRFREHAPSVHAARRRTRTVERLREVLAERFVSLVETQVLSTEQMDQLVDRLVARTLDPYTAAAQILERALGTPK